MGAVRVWWLLPSPYHCKDSRHAWREEATTSCCHLRISFEISSALRVLGALASRSRLVKGQRREGSRKRLEPSLVRHSLRRIRHWTCSSLARLALIGCGRCIGGEVFPLCSACSRPCPNRFNPVCPRPGTSERADSGLVARKISVALGSTKNGGLCWRRASSSRNRKRLCRTASPCPSRSLAPLTERYAVSRFGAVYLTSSILAHSSATHATRPKDWSRWSKISRRAKR